MQRPNQVHRNRRPTVGPRVEARSPIRMLVQCSSAVRKMVAFIRVVAKWKGGKDLICW